jgi:hypothetical protein
MVWVRSWPAIIVDPNLFSASVELEAGELLVVYYESNKICRYEIVSEE